MSADVIADDQPRRPGTEPLIGDYQFVEEAIVATIPLFIAAAESWTIAPHLFHVHDVDTVDDEITLDGTPLSEEARQAIQEELDAAKGSEPAEAAGELAEDQVNTLEVDADPVEQVE